MVVTGSDEYRFANDAYEALDLAYNIFKLQAERTFYLIGTPQGGWMFRRHMPDDDLP